MKEIMATIRKLKALLPSLEELTLNADDIEKIKNEDCWQSGYQYTDNIKSKSIGNISQITIKQKV